MVFPERFSVVIDLDGTLCDTHFRQHLAVAKQWDEFHEKMETDTVHRDIDGFLSICYQKFNIILLTGRPEKYRQRTLLWLNQSMVPCDELIMKPDGCYDPTAGWKLKALEGLFGTKEGVLQNVLFCLEDRDKIVESFRNYGLPCWQVRSGGY